MAIYERGYPNKSTNIKTCTLSLSIISGKSKLKPQGLLHHPPTKLATMIRLNNNKCCTNVE